MTQTAIPDMSPLPEYGDLMTIEEFVDGVEHGLFTDDDGKGFYATEDEMTDIEVPISDVREGIYGHRWTHVIWFNK